MRKVVLAAFQQMLAEAALNSNPDARKAALREASKLAVWKRLKPQTDDPEKWLRGMTNQLLLGDRNDPRLDCNDFSELIRVIGEWIEKGGGFGILDFNKSYRVGVGRIETPGDASLEYLHYLVI